MRLDYLRLLHELSRYHRRTDLKDDPQLRGALRKEAVCGHLFEPVRRT
jgi:hypothetical protein